MSPLTLSPTRLSIPPLVASLMNPEAGVPGHLCKSVTPGGLAALCQRPAGLLSHLLEPLRTSAFLSFLVEQGHSYRLSITLWAHHDFLFPGPALQPGSALPCPLKEFLSTQASQAVQTAPVFLNTESPAAQKFSIHPQLPCCRSPNLIGSSL